MVLLETAIESVLKEKNSEEEINSFYLDFKENYDSYKGSNDEAFAVMNASIDFAKFKQQMLDYKRGVSDVDKKDQEKLNTEGDGLEFFTLMKEDFKDSKSGWNKVVDVN